MTRTPRSVRWALLLMAGLVMSQVVGVKRIGRAADAGGLEAATAVSSPSVPAWARIEAQPVAASRPASRPGCASRSPVRRAT